MSMTLLLADDSITIQRVIELTFSDEQVRVISVGDGQQAIQRIEAERPDIVLADVGMPKVDGYGVAAHVKGTAALRHIPVLLLTGAFEPIDENRARATGCDGILVKPFKPEELLERVRELMAGQHSEKLWPAELPRVEAADTPVVVRLAPVAPKPAATVPPPAPSAVASFLTPAPVRTPTAIDVTATAFTPSVSASDIDHDVFALPEPSEMLRPANRTPPQPESPRPRLVHRDLPPPADAFDSELDMLDMALARLEPTARPQKLDAETASDFERDLQTLRSEQPFDAVVPSTPTDAPVNRQAFGDWDLPAIPGQRKHEPRESPVVFEPKPFAREVDPIDYALEHFEGEDASRSFEPVAAPAAPQPDVRARVEAIVEPVIDPVVEPVEHFETFERFELDEPVDAIVEPMPQFMSPMSAPTPVAVAPVPVAPAPPAPSAPEAVAPAPLAPAPEPTPVAAPVPVAAPAVPVAPVAPAASAPVAPAAPMARPSLASAFSALLAAEQAQPPARTLAAAAPQLSEAAVEDVVKRVLSRMTDDAVHKVVLDAAERLIREEIGRIKNPSDSSGH